MAKNINKKLDRLHKLTIMFNHVADVVAELLNKDMRVSDDHKVVVASAIELEGRPRPEAQLTARDLLYCLTDNKDLYRQKYVRG